MRSDVYDELMTQESIFSTKTNNMNIEAIIQNGIKSIDLTNERHAALIIKTANDLLKEYSSFSELKRLESTLIDRQEEEITFLLLALKLALSKSLVSQVKEPLHISVLFAVYKEHQRIRKSHEHPHGEDFLIKKIQQMEWLFEGQELVTWDLTIVDDGCPENSGEIAQKIIEKYKLQNKARVLFLNDAISQSLPPAKMISSTNNSQKGGSILYGMWNVAQNKRSQKHIVVFTDADLSTHLGQLMLLADPIVNNNKLAAIGSRREKESVVVKKGARNNRGKLFIYLWKRMIPNLGDIIDTQCGFKAFRADIVPKISLENVEYKFAFDVELLIKTTFIEPNSISKIPIAWIDSDAASTTADLQPYLPMLQSIASMQLKYFSDKNKNNDFVDFVNALNEDDFNRLLENIPQDIVEREPGSFSNYNGVSVDDLKKVI